MYEYFTKIKPLMSHSILYSYSYKIDSISQYNSFVTLSTDFSYQEAFLTTYRTFVSPLQLIEKLNKRHIFLARHGKHTKAREVQALLTRVVGDLT